MEGALEAPKLRELIEYTLFDGPAPASANVTPDLEDADKN